MNYQDKNNLTFNKKKVQHYGGGDQYEGGNVQQHSNLLLVEGGSILKVSDNFSLLRVEN